MQNKQHIPYQKIYVFHKKAAEILHVDLGRLKEVCDVLMCRLIMPGIQAEGWAENWRELLAGLNAHVVAELICKGRAEGPARV